VHSAAQRAPAQRSAFRNSAAGRTCQAWSKNSTRAGGGSEAQRGSGPHQRRVCLRRWIRSVHSRQPTNPLPTKGKGSRSAKGNAICGPCSIGGRGNAGDMPLCSNLRA
jgi:hypothetical protein